MRGFIMSLILTLALASGGCGDDDGNGSGGGGPGADGGTPSSASGCDGYCEWLVGCFTAGTIEQCTDGCEQTMGFASGACLEAWDAFGACLAGDTTCTAEACDDEVTAVEEDCESAPTT